MTRRNEQYEKQTERLQSAMGQLKIALKYLDFIELRLRQTLRRTRLFALLDPAFDELKDLARSINLAYACIADALDDWTQKEK